eukprot:TRINITY_DN8583_c0_g1_i1.p1 TRINITY_DN8583_c0_g1~~TRINITY_DN8583_c0_g1_i1.p1  ORF type:complete len:230 (+),score=23.20 TRINITY_DN8583_c0_g1_i1:199-888(+)
MVKLIITDAIEQILRASAAKAKGDVRKDIAAALKGEWDGDSDDSLAKEEPLTVDWLLLKRCWRMMKGTKGMPENLHPVIEGTKVYTMRPGTEWRLRNPKRKEDYKKMKEIRTKGAEHEYKQMTQTMDAGYKQNQELASIKESLSLPMDFFVLILCAVPAAYVIAKMSAREEYGWILAAVAAAGLVMVEGVLITIRLSKVDGWITPIDVQPKVKPHVPKVPQDLKELKKE